MNARELLQHRGRKVTRFAAAILLAGAAVVFWRPLVAWFGMKPLNRSSGPTVAAPAGPFMVETRLDPDPPRQTDNSLLVQIADGTGRPVDDAAVSVEYSMPAMGSMPEMRGSAEVSREDGRYRGTFDLPMGGTWTLEVSVEADGRSGSARYTLTVGAEGLTPVGGAPGAAVPGFQEAPSPDEMGGLSHAGHGHAGSDVAHYTCSMHPSVKQESPGLCPMCSMDLTPVTFDEEETGVIHVDPVRRQRIGVRTGPVVRAPMRRTIRAVGRLTYDETRLKDVTLKIRGWIVRLHVDQTGQRVRKGEPLFTLYSPELLAAQQEYLIALRSQRTAGEAGDVRRVEYMVETARKKLLLWDLTAAQLDELAAAGRPQEEVPILSPVGGFVIDKSVVEGTAVEPAQRLYRLAALDRVWIDVDVYEGDLPLVKPGQEARVTLSYLPGERFAGRVAYVYPYLRSVSRTGRVRVELPNPDLALKPDMYANVEIDVDLGERLQVPVEAVLYTGPRRLVFVDLGEGRLRPQEVKLGLKSEGAYEVLEGLIEGQLVVTSGNFVVAAESRIRTAATFWEASDETR